MTIAGPLSGSLALVTGASRGLGRAVALELARRGAHVVTTGRTAGALEALDDEVQALGGQTTISPFDLCDPEGIERLAAAIGQRWGRLDILAGNAGTLGDLTPVADIGAKVWNEAFALNVTANWRLIRAFDPYLRASAHGRAAFLTSGAAQAAKPFWGVYAATKAALEQMVLTYAHETETLKLRVNLVSPGPLRTAMRAKAMPGEKPETLRPPGAIAPAIADLLSPDETRTGQIVDLRGVGV
ncbi:MAG: SDR family NAD(P)-dependent oxidoreductase [Parvularculaceae bacterium]